MKISVAICTWNRASLLRKTLERFCQLRLPPDADWEVVVVNNNCTDDTDAAIAEYDSRLPIREVVEHAQGHSHARNRAVREADGDFIIWTDDDVLVDQHWVAEYVSAFRRHPESDFFAGPIRPWFEVEPPQWMRQHLDGLSGVLVVVNHGETMRPLRPGEAIFGANMAVRRTVAAEFSFSPKFGRVKDVLTGGDDTDFLCRIQQAGHHTLWVPNARVEHFVPQNRLTESYVKRWFRDAGRIVARTSPDGKTSRLGGVPRWVLRRYIQELIKAWALRPARNRQWFESYRQSLILQGMILEMRKRRDTCPTALPQ